MMKPDRNKSPSITQSYVGIISPEVCTRFPIDLLRNGYHGPSQAISFVAPPQTILERRARSYYTGEMPLPHRPTTASPFPDLVHKTKILWHVLRKITRTIPPEVVGLAGMSACEEE